MKKALKIILIIILSILIIGICIIYRLFLGPSVGMKEKAEVKKYAENYLSMKYGDHNYKITDIEYEFDMSYIFDYSNPTGYWVDFTSDVVAHSWITIDGLNPDKYQVNNDYFVESYYFSDMDGYDVSKTIDDMIPRLEIEAVILEELKNEFDSNIYEVDCEYIALHIPENYGGIPTLESLKSDISLYKILSFDYKVSKAIEDTNEYEERLKAYIANTIIPPS